MMQGRHQKRDRQKVTRYLRNRGSICFARQLFWPDDPVAQLLAGDLHWLWTSDRRDGSVSRQLTVLSEATAAELKADFAERDEDECGHFISLFGAQQTPEQLNMDWLRAELRRLVAKEDGNLQIVAIRPDDGNEDYLHVRQEPSLAVARLLHDWDLNETADFKDRKYQALRTMTLERLFDLGSSA